MKKKLFFENDFFAGATVIVHLLAESMSFDRSILNFLLKYFITVSGKPSWRLVYDRNYRFHEINFATIVMPLQFKPGH